MLFPLCPNIHLRNFLTGAGTVMIVIAYGLEDQSSFPNMAASLSSPQRPDGLWGPPSLLSNGYRGSFLGVKRPGRETNHSPRQLPSLRMRGDIRPLPPYVYMVLSWVPGTTLPCLHCQSLKIKMFLNARKLGLPIHRVYQLKRNSTTITYHGTKMKSEAGPPSCNRLSQPPPWH
jgi:hypothetical protein